MNRSIRTVPGTVFPADDIAAEGGEAFLDKVFYVSDGVMLSTVREITGQDTMALQNWVKRKWVPNPVKKTYDRERLARILIINALRDTLQIARILYLLKYINGTEPEDRIIPESRLYGLFCRVTGGVLRQGSGDLSSKRFFPDLIAGMRIRLDLLFLDQVI